MSNSKKELGTKYRGISIETANEISKKECPERMGDVLFDDKLKRKHKQILNVSACAQQIPEIQELHQIC